MIKLLKKYSKEILIFVILLLGFLVRVYYIDKVIVGDILSYVEWGNKIWEFGTKNYYFGQHVWTYSPPNYPPLSALLFGGFDWIFRHKYFLAQLHNLIKVPPAFFIIYFYKYGEIFLYKMFPILCDLALGLVIFKLIKEISGSFKKAILGLAFFVLNPITIFISGVWGQTDSPIALFGLLSFIFLSRRKLFLSMLLFFVSMYLKPSWGIFVPFYLYIIYLVKPQIKNLIIGVLGIIVLSLLISIPFSDTSVLGFTKAMWIDKYVIPIKSVGKASVSAFNFFTVFYKIDRDFFDVKVLGLISANKLSFLFYVILNVIAFKFVKKSKSLLNGVIMGVLVIGWGSFIFMVNMLERYFFPGFASLVIVMFCFKEFFIYGFIANIIFFANLIWAFYRRGSDEIDHPFTGNNFLLIRILSVIMVGVFLKFLTLYGRKFLFAKRNAKI